MENILKVNGLRKDYGEFKLKDVSFGLPGGYVMGFIGPNGAGKTTTIKLILDLIKADGGSVGLNGRAGVVMDSPMYVDDWRVDDVEKAVSPFYKKWDAKKYAGYLKQFGLSKKKKVKDLSRGMKVKLQTAVALSHDPALLILDEPTSGLDPVARDEMCDLIRDFVSDENHGVLFSTHITSDLEKVADYVTFILNGEIVFTGTKEDLLGKYSLVKGGLNEIGGADKKLIIGLREYGTGFEGMIETENKDRLPKNLLIEEITLDDIIIYMNKGARLHE